MVFLVISWPYEPSRGKRVQRDQSATTTLLGKKTWSVKDELNGYTRMHRIAIWHRTELRFVQEGFTIRIVRSNIHATLNMNDSDRGPTKQHSATRGYTKHPDQAQTARDFHLE